MRQFKIGTRGSKLALWQAEFLKAELKSLGIDAAYHIIKTRGDQIQHLSFDKIEGKGFFTKEIEAALLAKEVDIAVHSMKDLPTTPPDGLVLGAVSYRHDARDVLIIKASSHQEGNLLQLKENPLIGTSSARRKAQIKSLLPTCRVKDLRGNVPTRIQKLKDGDYDAILLAKAGIERLGLDLSDLHIINLNPKEFVPAPAQGVLAFQCRIDDFEVRQILQKLHHNEVSSCTNIERGVLKKMEGGCHLPLGVHVERDINGYYHANAAYSSGMDQPLKHVSLSLSTSSGLTELIYNELTKV